MTPKRLRIHLIYNFSYQLVYSIVSLPIDSYCILSLMVCRGGKFHMPGPVSENAGYKYRFPGPGFISSI